LFLRRPSRIQLSLQGEAGERLGQAEQSLAPGNFTSSIWMVSRLATN
jgi:hypothetical protein